MTWREEGNISCLIFSGNHECTKRLELSFFHTRNKKRVAFRILLNILCINSMYYTDCIYVETMPHRQVLLWDLKNNVKLLKVNLQLKFNRISTEVAKHLT